MIWKIPVEPTYEMLFSRIQSTETIIREKEQINSVIDEIEQLIIQKDISVALTKFNKLIEIESFASSEKYFEINRKLALYCIFRQLNRCVLRKVLNPTCRMECYKYHLYSRLHFIRFIYGGLRFFFSFSDLSA